MLISLFFTILTLCLSSLSFHPSTENYQANLSLRRIRVNSLFSKFTDNPGKAFSFEELESLGFSEDQLSQLVANQKIVEIHVGREQAGEDYQGNIYLLPRENIVSQELIQIINLINPEQVKYFTYTRSISQFKQDLTFITEHWKEQYSSIPGVEYFKIFTDYFFPKVIHIVGDNLEMLVSKLSHTWNKLLSHVDLRGLLTEKEVGVFLTEELQNLEENIRLRQIYAQEHNIHQELKEIILELNDTLSSLITIGEEFHSDNLLGILIIGSWARENPHQYTDLDFVSISEESISVKFARELEEKIKIVLGTRVATVHNLKLHEFILNQPGSIRDIISFDENGDHTLYVRNFIVIAQDEATLDRIIRQILDAQPLLNVP